MVQFEKDINKPNQTALKRFSIIGLFGRYDVSLDFSKEVNIFIGENGLGKTTILNCLYFILEKKYEELESITFMAIEIELNNLKKYRITKADIRSFLQKNKPRFYRAELDDLIPYVLDSGFSVEDILTMNDGVDEFIRKLAHERDIPLPFLRNRIMHYASANTLVSESDKKGNEKSVVALTRALKESITERVIYLPTYRRIENEFSTLQTRERSNKSELLIRFGMSDVQTSIDRILNKIKNLAMQGFNQMTGLLLKQYIDGEDSIETNTSQLDQTVVNIVLERLGPEIADSLKIKIVQLIESGKIYTPKYQHLYNLLQKIIANYDLQKKYDDRIQSFTKTCNKYLNDKQFVYDPRALSLNVYLDAPSLDTPIDLRYLSSGEKQIVSVFSKLYLEDEEDNIIIIDEPELSLSIAWQQIFIPDIMASNRCRLLLSVTHSPFIFENKYDQFAKEMRSFMSVHK